MRPRGTTIVGASPRRAAFRPQAAFTLLEVLLAMFIFAGVLAAIYASWTAILRASDAVRMAAAETQRSRIGVRALEEGLASAQYFAANARHYAFLADTTSEEPALSFVARVPASYPRGGRFGDLNLRRLTFTVEPDPAGGRNLVLRQTPLLFEVDADEAENPLVLAHNVLLFHLEFWGAGSREWEQEWLMTNQMPRLVKFSLAAAPPGASGVDAEDVVSRVVVLPSATVISAGLSPGAPLPPIRGGPTNPAPGSPRVR